MHRYNRWAVEGEYLGLSKIEKAYLKKFNYEFYGEKIEKDSLHAKDVKKELWKKCYRQRYDALNRVG